MQSILNKLKYNFSKENTLKLLILLALLAIVYSLYSQYLVPYLEEIEVRKQDEMRINDINKLDEALKATLSTSTAQNLASSTVYISIPSNSPTCADLELPKLPTDWKYNCVTKENLTNTDGTGWIPIDLSNKFSELPIDLNNDTQRLNFYTSVFNRNTTKHVVTAKFSSEEGLKIAREDSGLDDIRYERGDTKLWASTLEILSYWEISNSNKPTVLDKSNNGNDTEIIGLIDDGSQLFNSKTYIEINATEQFNPEKELTISTSFNSNSAPMINRVIIMKGRQARESYRLDIEEDNVIRFKFTAISGDKFSWNVIDSGIKFQSNRTYKVLATMNSKQVDLFIDGKHVGNRKIDKNSTLYSGIDPLLIGTLHNKTQFFTGNIENITLYNRSLEKNTAAAYSAH